MPSAPLTGRYLIAIATMFVTFALLRLLFREVDELKLAFIYPTGWLVHSFLSSGVFALGEWHFSLVSTLAGSTHGTRFILGESCSGTTFFCLLCAFFALRRATHGISGWWLIAAWPITLVANAIRVLSAIYLHKGLAIVGLEVWQASAHVITGTLTFLTLLLVVSWWVERPRLTYG